MIIKRIQAHNYINGFLFSTIEFFLMALVISPFALYYITHARYVMAFISFGILFNCLPFVYCGIRSLINKEKGLGVLQLYRKKTKEAILRQYPHLALDTSLLTVIVLLPFVTIVLYFFDLLRRKNTK